MLTSVQEVIAALGGPTKLGKLVNRMPQSPVNWRRAGRFPPDTYLAMQDALRERGLEAPPSLWGMVERAS